jgi:1-phosphofructokinase family hexose kinase
MGFIGGATGQKLKHGLEDLGIKTQLVPIKDETRTNIVITEAGNERYIKVNEAGPTLQAMEIDALYECIKQRIQPGDICALCGSLPPGTPDNFYADMVTLIQDHGARALLDTSGIPLSLGIEACPFLVKPNVLEAAALTGHELNTLADAEVATAILLRAGANIVALSMGAQGMILATKQHANFYILHAEPPQIKVKHPTGAGDALLAGIIYALDHGWSMAETARWGVASGTAAAMREGVSVGSFAEIQRLAPYVSVEEKWSVNE